MSENKFLYTEEGKQWLQTNYIDGDYSAKDIVVKFALSYPNVVYRALRHHGLPRKHRSTAQSDYLRKNPEKHPTAGKERTLDEKKRIGLSMHHYWKDISEDTFQARIDKSREMWYNIPEATRKRWLDKSHASLRESAKSGSKFEKYLLAALLANNFKVQPHKKFLFENSEMSVDAFLPLEGICVEVNGVSHYLPVWGEEALEKTIQRDLLKTQQLLAEGYSVVIIQNENGYHSTTVMEKVAHGLIKLIKEVVKRPNNTLTELVVEDLLAIKN